MTASRIPILLAMLAAGAGAGCDRLGTSPGKDFALRLLTPTPIVAVGKITVPVEIEVAGCPAFDAEVRGAGASHAVGFVRKASGTWQADVPVEWLREEDRTCLNDAEGPRASTAQLTVSCRDAGRVAAADVAVSYGTAKKAVLATWGLPQATVQYLFPGPDPVVPYALAPSVVEDWIADLFPVISGASLWQDGQAMLTSPLVRPRLASRDGLLFHSAGCDPRGTCPALAVGTATVAAEALQGTSTGPGGQPSGWSWWPVWVPAHVVDLSFLPGGELMVLSEVHDGGPWPIASAVTRVVPGPPTAERPYSGTADVQVIAYFPREKVESRFSRTADGRLAYVSLVMPESPGPAHTVLHTTDGQVVDAAADPTGALFVGERYGTGSLSYGSLALSPDASSLAVSGAYLGAPGETFAALPSARAGYYSLDGDRGGAVWLDGGVALWKGASFLWHLTLEADDGWVELFDAAPPHARRWGYDLHPLPGSGATAQLYGATAVGDKLVLTTSTGVRVLDRDGNLVGGADPLPCGLSPTALAVAAGPTTAAVGAGPYVYVFDLAD